MIDHPNPERQSARISVDYEGVLVASDGHEMKVKVKDLSAQGFKIELADEVLPNELVELRVGRHERLAAQILWVRGSEAGGVFLDQPSPGTLKD